MKRSSLRRLPAALVLLAALCGVLALAPAAWAAPALAGSSVPAVPPSPTRWVTDGAGFLSPAAREALDARLQEYQQATGHQVLVWIGDTTGAEPLEDYTVRAFAAWRVGRKGIDDGLAIFVFAADRKVRIEVGYGLEGKVPDAIASRIVNEVIVPRLKAGDKDGAVTAGADAAMGVVEGRPWSSIEGAGGAVGPGTGTDLGPAAGVPPAEAYPGSGPTGETAAQGGVGARRPPDFWHTPAGTILKWILIAAFLLLLVTHPGLAFWLLLNIISGGRGGGGGGGGGGGFSGGGGRSGGGGASGSW
jgi:uncharacterized protein